MCLKCVLLFAPFICFVVTKSLPDKNNSSVLISEYAKVAHWGSARSSQGQKPWTQHSEGSFSYGQNLKGYRSYDTSLVPAVGEVQERFNPKPYFIYGPASTSNTPVEKFPTKNVKSPVYLPTIPPTEALTIHVLPTTEPKAHDDPYNSPFSSYNPPPKNNEEDEQSYIPSQNQMNSSHGDETNQHPPEDEYIPQSDYSQNNNPPAVGHIAHSDDYFHPSYFPEIHGQPDHHVKTNGLEELILNHAPPAYVEKKPLMDQTALEQFPHYLYDDAHTSLHTEHEVDGPKEQKRVSKPQYSYYYIGRKLWYIPLYFSVYFIIYVTFLILKSIARHKIQFKHDLVDLHSRKSRERRFSSIRKEDLNVVHRNVDVALEEGKIKFPLVAM